MSHPKSGVLGILLFATALLAFLCILFTEVGDTTRATLSLAGIACLVGGAFAVTLGRDNPVNPELASCLASSYTYTYAASQACTGLNAEGNAFFIPPDREVRQFVPADGGGLPPDISLTADRSGHGILLPPTAAPLLKHLEENHALALPSEKSQIFVALKEILTDTLEVADQVTGRQVSDRVFVDIIGYRLFSGCAVARAEKPECCTISPCPICSLVACAFAKGMGKVTTIDRVTINPDDRSLHLQVRFMERMPASSVHSHESPAPQPLPDPSEVRASRPHPDMNEILQPLPDLSEIRASSQPHPDMNEILQPLPDLSEIRASQPRLNLNEILQSPEDQHLPSNSGAAESLQSLLKRHRGGRIDHRDRVQRKAGDIRS
ncbi:hypothetical protein FGU65_02205 [Methanoculleus sp. FWC-SCC1]|uniref:DUF7982 domain-containing protein n=1 Tax=Methanoculleus frigidifontis TaxID=2584085 RepID=A0ABT8M746_9EURY|nr:hypothetical protein [Methanoculleus sp. FWC-SCC1]MDN7023719.1 hypothetical protein [Methanoculleus sp. FWC-SCC1]